MRLIGVLDSDMSSGDRAHALGMLQDMGISETSGYEVPAPPTTVWARPTNVGPTTTWKRPTDATTSVFRAPTREGPTTWREARS
jgi:hypothetical protein